MPATTDFCHECGHVFEETQLTNLESRRYCSRCYSRHTRQCPVEGCSERTRHSICRTHQRTHTHCFRHGNGCEAAVEINNAVVHNDCYFCSEACLDITLPQCQCGQRHRNCPHPRLPTEYEECYLPNRVFAIELETSYPVDTPEGWTDVGDGSISGREYLTGPVLGQVAINKIQSGCRFMNKQRKSAIVDERCGYHIHLNARDLTEEQVALFVQLCYHYQDDIFKLVPMSRQTGCWCKKLHEKFKKIESLSFACYNRRFAQKPQASGRGDFDRYIWVNLASYYYRGTIEIRLHAGTTNPRKVLNWAELMLKLLEYAAFKNPNYQGVDLWETMALAGVRVETIEFYKSRAEKFSGAPLEEYSHLEMEEVSA